MTMRELVIEKALKEKGDPPVTLISMRNWDALMKELSQGEIHNHRDGTISFSAWLGRDYGLLRIGRSKVVEDFKQPEESESGEEE